MPALSPSALRNQLAGGKAGPLYVLYGADEVEKAAVAGEFGDLVEEGLRAFNVDRLYGADTTVDALLDVANTFPMMAERRVVLVLDAEKVLVPKKDADLEQLEAFLAAPPPHATIVFVCGSFDKRRRTSKILEKVAHLVDCGTLETPDDAVRWVKARAARDKVPLDAGAIDALAARGGVSLPRLRAGLERVALYALGQATITADDVRQVVAAGPDTQENFGIANAIRGQDVSGALRQLWAALDGGVSPFLLMGQIRVAAEGVNAPRLPAAIEAVFRTDIALKSSGGEPRLLLERLVVELCGSGRGSRPSGPPPGRYRPAGRP
jgi:DNA polymerase-3 subunit delta